ncbi:MAG: hypothetical protein U0527_16780 [Candidatus Eisenbacteria bacterium]
MQSRSAFWCSLALGFLILGPSLAPIARAQVTSAAIVQEVTPNPRAQAMGNAFTAVGQDPWAAWWNPGALASMRDLSVGLYSTSDYYTFGFGKWTVHSAAIAGARNGLGYGAHFSRFTFGETSEFGDAGELGATYKPSQIAMHLAGAVELMQLVRGRPGPFSFGVGLGVKGIHAFEGYSGTARNKKKITANGYDADLGALLTAKVPLRRQGRPIGSATVSIGTTERNVFDRDLSFGKHGRDYPLVRLNRRGAAIHVEVGNHPALGPLGELTLAMDRTAGPHNVLEREIRNRGLELGLAHMLYLRWGRIEDRAYGTVSNTRGWGFGPDVILNRRLQSLRIRIDYARTPRPSGLKPLEQYALSVGLGV